MSKAPEIRRGSGFTPAARLLQSRIRAAGEKRGFAVSRLLTHWEEIVGPQIAAACRPVEVKYGREGMGAALTLLVSGPMAPMVEMQKAQILDRVNACYGYRAIARLRITQTAATGFAPMPAAAPAGFAEAQDGFAAAPKAPDPRAVAAAEGIADTELRLALAALAANVLGKRKP